MLLPAKFQTPTPAPLGAKVVAIAPAPKPHVHQWVSVPDSKIHSRCAECGTVTLTEIVAPKPTFAELCGTPARYYISITSPLGVVRMVETDAEGWIKNDGTQPVADMTEVEVKCGGVDRPSMRACNFDWGYPLTTHWRPAV